MLIKRILDVAVAAVASIALAPVFLAVAIAVRWKMGSPVLFRQRRSGLNNRTFEILKFRTMYLRPDAELAIPDQNQPRLGTKLREWSLDELPELYNVLRGDMSLVGPRPLLADYLNYYRPSDLRRHEMKPGITGLAQINGRQGLKFSERFHLDVWYIEHWSLWLDAQILFRTFIRMGARDSKSGFQTIEEIDDLGLCQGLKRPAPEKQH